MLIRLGLEGSLLAAVAISLSAAGCAGGNRGGSGWGAGWSGDDGGGGGDNEAASGDDAGSLSFGEGGSSDAVHPAGSGCSDPGAAVACWTGPASDRNRGACRDGIQQCAVQSEQPTWGPCTGQVLDCGSADSGPPPVVDACSPKTCAAVVANCGTIPDGCGGTLDCGSCPAGQSCGGAGTSNVCGTPPACTSSTPPGCVPGSTRWCDDGSCYWGTQTCQADRSWGSCVDTPGNSGPSGCPAGSPWYDENCCEQSGQCCAHAAGGTNYGSVGNCDQVEPCNECRQLCVPGAVRWCSYQPDASQPPIAGSWGQQPCRSDGTWGACAPATSAPPGCGEAFDQSCCAASGQCCEVFDSEYADPASVNCPSSACNAQWADSGAPAASAVMSAPANPGPLHAPAARL